jgi:GT2 family glycosyltransferase
LSSVLTPRTEQARVVAVVLNWNAWSDTIACVESLFQSTRVPDRIVVCDNGSRDGSMMRLFDWARARGEFAYFDSPERALASDDVRESLVLVDVGENLGYAGGNNVGIRYALAGDGADFVWILNNDVVVERNALANMLDVAQSDESAAIVGSKLLRFDQPDTIQALGGGYIIPVLCHDTQLGSGKKSETSGGVPIELDHVVGASLLVRREAIESVGLIDESYFLYREETDWCIRMRQDGWKLFCCTEATVWHKQANSIGFNSPLHDYYAVRNMLMLVRKFYPSSLPTAFSYFACRSIGPKLARLQFVRLMAVLAAYRDFLTGVSGRSALHPDPVIMRDYRNEAVAEAVPQRSWKAVAASIFVAGFLAAASAFAAVGVAAGGTLGH